MLDNGVITVHLVVMFSSAPFSLPNVRLFLAFRLLFNARFYYPVFTILFLDFGLSLEQFALLNTVWAFTIVLAEVPSGALADLLGRKHLLVATTMLMMVEMSIIAFVPLGNGTLIFTAFLVNRILSGLAEAMASGADEAMVYDSLVEKGMADQWPKVLDLQMRVQNVGYLFAMTLGAVVYDPGMVNRLISWLGGNVQVTQQMTMRYPIYLTLVFSVCAFWVTMKMRDPKPVSLKGEEEVVKGRLWEMTRITFQAGGWIIRTPFALAIILFAMTFDHILRMIVTMTSQYYRLIDVPEALFGVLGSTVAIIGLLVPRVARAMVERLSPAKNALFLTGLALVTLLSLTLFIPYLGAIPMFFIFIGMMMTSFFTSHYLNQITESHQRATVLSFKGLAFNAAYGCIGIFYAVLIQQLRHEQGRLHPEWSELLIENAAFKASIGWFPGYLIIILTVVALICLPRLYKASRRRGGR